MSKHFKELNVKFGDDAKNAAEPNFRTFRSNADKIEIKSEEPMPRRTPNQGNGQGQGGGNTGGGSQGGSQQQGGQTQTPKTNK